MKYSEQYSPLKVFKIFWSSHGKDVWDGIGRMTIHWLLDNFFSTNVFSLVYNF